MTRKEVFLFVTRRGNPIQMDAASPRHHRGAKRSKKTLVIWTEAVKPALAQMSKRFLVFFFKKEHLPFSPKRRLLLASTFTLAGLKLAHASLPAELAQPALLSPLAAYGLFNAISPAGARLVAVGERGRIMLSDDAGQSWRQVPAPVSVTLIAAHFPTPTTGYIAGQMGVVLKTIDAGESWSKVLDGVSAAAAMLAAANADRALLTPAQAAAQDNAAMNNNTSTELQNAQLLVSEGPANPILCLVAASETHVLAFGAFGLALETRDGGATWAGIAARVPDPQDLHIYGARLSGTTLILVGEQGLIMRGPVDGTLAPITSPFPGSLFGMTATADNKVLAYGVQGAVLVSADNGASWAQMAPNSNSGILSSLELADKRLVLGDESGNLLVTSDAGAHFSLLPAAAPVTALAQGADGALVVGSPMGLRRLPLAALGTAS
jgi:photosystem II stability/assembly factor-like uncharacterized protein